jgi:peptidoglycan/xylan/chitin deacetylase (PgdA/CDA1 family)
MRAAGWILPALLLACSVSARAGEPPETDVTIVSSRANQLVLEKAGLDYRSGIKLWSSACKEANLSFRVAGDYELTTAPLPARVYVLHMTERLSQAQRENLLALHKSGVSLVFIGMAGMFDEEGKRTPSLPEELLGLEDVAPFQSEKGGFLVSRSQSVFSLGNEPGFRFEFGGDGRYFLARTPWSTATNVTWDLSPRPAEEGKENGDVMAVRTLGESRLAWFGIAPDYMSEEGPAKEFLKASLSGLLLWAARRPVAAPCFWRNCSVSSTVVTADVEDQFQNAETIALICHEQQVKGSFFVVGKLAVEYPETVTALAENGEVGSHSMRHESMREMPLEQLVAELRESKEACEPLTRRPLAGFRPPMEEFDETTLRAMMEVGIDFIYGNENYDRAYPITRELDGRRLYQFSRSAADDYNLKMTHKAESADDYMREFVAEFEKNHDFGGLFAFSFHTNHLAMKSTVDSIRAIIAHMKKKDTWLTTFSELVQWMEARRQVKVSARQEESTSVITVSNSAAAPVKAMPVHLLPPGNVETLQLSATPETGIKIKKASRQGFVLLVDLLPGETKEIRVR